MSYGNRQSTYSKNTRVHLLRTPQKKVQWTFVRAFSRDAVFFKLSINVTHTQATVKAYVLFMYLYGYTVLIRARTYPKHYRAVTRKIPVLDTIHTCK